MATKIKVSESLNSIAQVPGDLIYRSNETWERIPAGEAGKVLTSNGPNAAPSWEDGGGGGGTLAATVWRMSITANNGSSRVTCAGIWFLDQNSDYLDSFTTRLTKATASSFANSSNTPPLAFDLNSTSKWTSGLPILPEEWVQFEFAAPVIVSKVWIMGQYAGGGQDALAPKDFTFQYANNPAGPFTQLGSSVVNQTGWAAAEIRGFVLQ